METKKPQPAALAAAKNNPRIHILPSNMKNLLEAAVTKGYHFEVEPITANIFTANITTPSTTVSFVWLRNGNSWRFAGASDSEGNNYTSSQAAALV